MPRFSNATETVGLAKRQPRSSAQKVRFLRIRDDNCEINTHTLIEEATAAKPFGPIRWESPEWNVSSAFTQRAHKGREMKLHFTQHNLGNAAQSRIGDAFSNTSRFDDTVKAIISLRAQTGGQGAANHQEVIIAFRYVYDELAGFAYDIRMLSRDQLEAAARAVSKRESKGSIYRRINCLEEIARILDENGLVRVPLDWRCSWNRKPSSAKPGKLDLQPVNAEAIASKLPQPGILEAVAALYQVIPKSEWADRIRICYLALLLVTGLRIGELLTLPARRVQTEEGTGRKSLAYYPEKGAPPTVKWLMTVAGELAESIVDELLALTADARAMAEWLHLHPSQVFVADLDLSQDSIKMLDFGRAMSFPQERTGTRQFLTQRRVPVTGAGVNATVSRDALVAALRSDCFEGSVNVVKDSGETLYLRGALACVFGSAFHSDKVTLRYAPQPILEQQLNDFMKERAGQQTVFKKYGLTAADGTELNVSSHAFRHWLNDMLDRGGLTDLEQAEYFGRRNPRDNKAYQHMTHGEKVKKAREDLKIGTLKGPVADLIRRVPIDRREAVLAARVRAVHVVPGGACFHDFSQFPCPKQMACKAGCGEFHWKTDDEVQTRELEFEKAVLEDAVETVRREVAEETLNADSWLQHNELKLEQVKKSIADASAKVANA